MTNTIIARLSIAISAVALSTAPAFAKPVETPAAVEAATAPGAPSMDQKICVKSRLTGSRIEKTVCRTRGEFIALNGFDPSVSVKK
ncbi:hypothetical protein [Sphingomonas sanxanigenens]|uniref:Uncharacterized protein n=1 Tax=Sphingomonas sanxanigenens DSM 19645 = NX02 TaxID=1123269 RepID=W0AF03_9SPHN|nr:hypothetical protein [Sphingomonas sanxanigenens]AHE54878.1 hypothetical protein NX02_15990 [Sphingomonas sanxanigenens DSM 19645 = NX02]